MPIQPHVSFPGSNLRGLYKADYYRLLRAVTEQNAWTDWVVFMLNGVADTARLTTNKIRRMNALMGELETAMKQTLAAKYDYDLLRLMFELPYLKINILERRQVATRQTAAGYLKRLSEAGILTAAKVGRTTYYINQRLIDLLTD